MCADLIGRVAARGAWLLSELAPAHDVSRDGSGRVVEVYPAAALWLWRVGRGPYGRAEHAERRRTMVACLVARAEGLLDMGEVDGIARSPPGDALVAALLARAAELRPQQLDPAYRDLAREEGWIHLPEAPDGLAGALTPP